MKTDERWKEKYPTKSYDENGVWDWRKDMGVPPEKIYNVVVTRVDGEKFEETKKQLAPNSWRITHEENMIKKQIIKTLWKLFNDRHDLLIRMSKQNTNKRGEFIFKMDEDIKILKKIKTRIRNLIKTSGLNIVMEEKTREYLFTDMFYGK